MSNVTTLSSTTDTAKTRSAPCPFDRPGADIILQASDMVNFRVYSSVLILASSFFETMLSLPQASAREQDSENGIPVIPVTEDSETLEALLRICYPIDKADSNRSILQIEKTLKAAIKYDMALPITVLRKELLAAVESAPVQAWAAACRTGSEEVARRAASTLLARGPLQIALEDIEGVSAGDYFRLREFHRMGGNFDYIFRLLTPSPTLVPPHLQASLPSDCHISPKEMPLSDLTLISSDGMEFRVNRWVVSVASPVIHERIQAQTSQSEVPAYLQLEVSGDVLSPSLVTFSRSSVKVWPPSRIF